MPFGGLLTVGLITAGSSIAGGIMGKSAADNAADKQAQSAREALDFQKQVWGGQQQNIAPYLAMGSTSIGDLMAAIQRGQQLPNAPQFGGAPTLEEARNTPGYQFTAQQGTKGILEAAGAAGGAISGGTLRAADQYNTGLADSTYNDVFSRSLATYNANLSGYQANMARQAQLFNESLAPVQIGAGAATGINQTGSQVATNAGNLMTGIGNAEAAGIVGGTNALSAGLNGAGSSAMQSVLLNRLFPRTPQPLPNGGMGNVDMSDIMANGAGNSYPVPG